MDVYEYLGAPLNQYKVVTVNLNIHYIHKKKLLILCFSKILSNP